MKLWLFDIFEREFLFSDTLANYSRSYAWMANQLGHLTLGIAAALGFAMVADGVDALDLRSAMTPDPGVLAGAVPTIGLVLLLWFRRGTLSRFSWPGRIAVIVAAGAFWWALVEHPEMEPRIKPGAAVAGLVWLCLLVLLAKDGIMLALATMIVVLAVAFVIVGAGATLEPQVIVVATVLATAAFIALLAYRLEALAPRLTGMRLEYLTAIVAWALLGFALYSAPTSLLLPVGAAVASIAVWFVKEYGSDLAGVQAEIDNAKSERQTVGATATEDALDRVYLGDAVRDIQTDLLFCMSGALLGAAILSPAGNVTDAARDWPYGLDVAAIGVFVIAFLVLGRPWVLRQQAVDLTEAPRANRLALFTGKVDLAVYHGTPGWLPVAQPLGTLLAFARGEPCGFEHLLITGGPATGKGPLAHALATEAALKDLATTAWTRTHYPVLPDGTRSRTARVISAEQCASIAERLATGIRYEVRDLTGHPTVDLRREDSPAPQTLRSPLRPCQGAEGADIHGAALLAVTDLRPGSRLLPRVFDGLFTGRPAAGRRLVFVVEDSDLGAIPAAAGVCQRPEFIALGRYLAAKLAVPDRCVFATIAVAHLR